MASSYVNKRCDECGEGLEQIFTDLRYARPTDLDKLDEELAAIGRERISIEEMNFDDVEDYTYDTEDFDDQIG